jgi:hypothetical protein
VIAALLLAALPLVYWTHGIDAAPSLEQAGIERVAVPANEAAAWQQAGFSVVATSARELAERTTLPVPGLLPRANRASPTQSPWITANGWRFRRSPDAEYVYELPAGRALLAAAESATYGVDALLQIDAADVEAVGRLLAFLKQLPEAPLPTVSDFGLVDDGTPLVGEVINLLTRRNLLFELLRAPSERFRLNVKVGSREYPTRDAVDPSAFALKVRRDLGDDQRTLRLFGSEGVIARLVGDASRVRLHLINYGGRNVEGLRVRVRGRYSSGEAYSLEDGKLTLEEHTSSDAATEVSLPRLGTYAVVDLKR